MHHKARLLLQRVNYFRCRIISIVETSLISFNFQVQLRQLQNYKMSLLNGCDLWIYEKETKTRVFAHKPNDLARNSPSCRVAVLVLPSISPFSFSASFPCPFNPYSNSTMLCLLIAPLALVHIAPPAHVLLPQALIVIRPDSVVTPSPYAPCDFKAAETWTTYVRKCARCFVDTVIVHEQFERPLPEWTGYIHIPSRRRRTRAGVRVSAASQEKASPSIGPAVHAGYRIVTRNMRVGAQRMLRFRILVRGPAFAGAIRQDHRSNKGSYPRCLRGRFTGRGNTDSVVHGLI